jgi:hypothetical protein
LTQKLEQGSIIFVDVPNQFPDLSPPKGAALLPLLDLVRKYIGILRSSTNSLVIFDELALFEWIGHSALDVSRFARALVASCAKASSTIVIAPLSYSYIPKLPSLLQNDVFLVIRFHMATPDDVDSILRILLQLATYHIEVLPLSSGRSGAVSGEVSRSGVSPARFEPISDHFSA